MTATATSYVPPFQSKAPIGIYFGTAAPSTGTYVRGDIVYNTTPSAAGAPGWVCTAGGSPGTFKAMAALAS